MQVDSLAAANMTLGAVKEVGSLVVSALALLVSALSVILMYCSRRASMRDAVYGKQLEVYAELSEQVCRYQFKLQSVLGRDEYFSAAGDKRKIVEEANELAKEFWKLYYKWLFILPRGVETELTAYRDASISVNSHFTWADKEGRSVTADPNQRTRLRDAFFNLLNKLKEEVGTEALSEEAKKLIEG